MKCLHLTITGKIQGIFFRANTKKAADNLNVVGWAKNVGIDKVEILMQGDDEAIKELIDYCKTGHDLAKIDNISIEHVKCQEHLPNFNIE